MKRYYFPTVALLSALLFPFLTGAQGRPAKPAPPASRYAYTLEIDAKALPDGVTIRTVNDNLGTRHFIKNTGKKPLIINERFNGETLVSGTKLVDGKVYQYFPNGVPMEGKTHLKGWQSPFGEIEETILSLNYPPEKIYEGRTPGLSDKIPAKEEITIPANYDGTPYAIKAVVHYTLNPEYDKAKKQ